MLNNSTTPFSLVKNPSFYDEYQFTLSNKYRKIACEELRETESVRNQSLQAIRAWIAKNPNIITCRTDSKFLLRFLRVTKFSVPSACAKLERFIYVHQAYPQWFANLSIDDPVIDEIISLGWILPLPEKDELGRQILFYRSGVIDPTKYSTAQMIRVQELIFQAVYDDEEVQIAGLVFAFDDTGFGLPHCTMWSVSDIKEITGYIAKALPLRQKMFIRAGLPNVARATYDLIRSFLVEKVRQRFQILKTVDDLSNIVNPKILPKEYGGSISVEDLVLRLKTILKEKQAEILLQDKMMVNMKKIQENLKTGEIVSNLVGNFRKLEVD